MDNTDTHTHVVTCTFATETDLGDAPPIQGPNTKAHVEPAMNMLDDPWLFLVTSSYIIIFHIVRYMSLWVQDVDQNSKYVPCVSLTITKLLLYGSALLFVHTFSGLGSCLTGHIHGSGKKHPVLRVGLVCRVWQAWVHKLHLLRSCLLNVLAQGKLKWLFSTNFSLPKLVSCAVCSNFLLQRCIKLHWLASLHLAWRVCPEGAEWLACARLTVQEPARGIEALQHGLGWTNKSTKPVVSADVWANDHQELCRWLRARNRPCIGDVGIWG